MKNVNVNNVRGFEKIELVRVDLSALPKTGFKNNRIHTYTTVKNGTQYCIPTYVELVANGEKICCELKPKLVGMDKFDKRYKCVVRDDILGNIIVWFDDLLQTKTFANRIKDELTRHLNNINEWAKKVDEATDLVNETNKRATEYNEKYTNECHAHENTKDDLFKSNQLAEQRLNQIMILTTENSMLKADKEKYGKATQHKDIIIRNLPRIVKTIIRLHKEGLSTDAIVEKIAKIINNLAE